MLIFDNTQETGTFSVYLRDKIVDNSSELFIQMIRIDDNEEFLFDLNNESTSDRYYTFTIPTSGLGAGQYDVRIFEGRHSSASEGCLLTEDTEVNVDTIFPCNPLTLEALLTVNDETIVSADEVLELEIYRTVGRVEGTEQTIYTNTSEPQYHTYDG